MEVSFGEVDDKIDLISEKTGLTREEIVSRAVVMYLKHLDRLAFDEEMKEWDKASEEDFLTFEKTI
jgi:hypothetical protein